MHSKSHTLLTILLVCGGIYGCTQTTGNQSTENQPQEMQETEKIDLLIGTYTGSGSEGIYRLSFNPETGELSDLRLAAEASSPSYLVISDDRQKVYSVGEREAGTVSAFEWQDDSLVLINNASVAGKNPCYVDFSDTEKLIAVANYSSGNVGFYPVGENGGVTAEPFVFQHSGSGPNPQRQEAPHAHCAIFSVDSRFVYVVDLGIDQVMAYPVSEGKVSAPFTALKLVPGDGPRHLVFHPVKDIAFIVNELSNTVVSVGVDKKTGMLEEIDRENTLPEDFKEHSQCADIQITSDGKFLYASNRGHNSIAIFSVDEKAQLTRTGTESVRGDWPRNFTLSPDERFLLVANQNSDNITVFSVDQETGLLTYTGNEISMSKPVCLKF